MTVRVGRSGFAPATWPPPTACTHRSGPTSAWSGPRGGPDAGASSGTSPSHRGATSSRCTGQPEAGEAYVTPVADDCVGIAILTSRQGRFEQHLDAFPALRELTDGHPHEPDRAAGPLRQRVRGRVAGRVLLVGDAAGYVDALTGEGLGLAFAAAAVAGRQRRRRPSRRLRAAVAQHHPPLPADDRRDAAGRHVAGALTHRARRQPPPAGVHRHGESARRLARCRCRQPKSCCGHRISLRRALGRRGRATR